MADYCSDCSLAFRTLCKQTNYTSRSTIYPNRTCLDIKSKCKRSTQKWNQTSDLCSTLSRDAAQTGKASKTEMVFVLPITSFNIKLMINFQFNLINEVTFAYIFLNPRHIYSRPKPRLKNSSNCSPMTSSCKCPIDTEQPVYLNSGLSQCLRGKLNFGASLPVIIPVDILNVMHRKRPVVNTTFACRLDFKVLFQQ